MATRAQQFRYEEERAKPKRAPSKKGARKAAQKGDAPEPGRRSTAGGTAARNVSSRAGRKAQVALEDSTTTPSRKSTRKAANRGKAVSNLERNEQRKRRTPQAKAASSIAKATTVRGHGKGKGKASPR